ncbi:winged helix-turn-helix domain-containing protein [Undibacterium sp. TS12]|uniref:ArsR/SmtB family transcription factor n=1 Tax=Undibacterium sp. TS12 TaxID=2908202 RepID=UPI001F4C9826|nr:winged helix-turn-helix domain-containing protein [Undibacterium sp. TS12]MCH8622352.1 winged helix-turn-helix domain-containing protein [Undibacterium sp. TS12]
MDESASITRIPHVAALLADPARAAMLWALIDGTTRPAGELAFAANVSAQSASNHLARLVEGGLLLSESRGRHRYFRIASPDAASLIEAMAAFSAGQHANHRQPPRPALARSMPSQFLHARTCYDHLAGEVAVQILATMLDNHWLAYQEDGKDFQLTALGAEKLAALGIAGPDSSSTQKQNRRVYARCCVDLTQRRPHLAGVLGAALLDLFVRQGWVLRSPGTRTVSITPRGRQAMQQHLGLPAFDHVRPLSRLEQQGVT